MELDRIGEICFEDVHLNLDKLPPATRAVCTLHYLEGFSIREISDQLKLSDGTIKWHLSESRNRLRTLFSLHSIKGNE